MELKIDEITQSTICIEIDGKAYLIKVPIEKFRIWFEVLPELLDRLELVELPEDMRLKPLEDCF